MLSIYNIVVCNSYAVNKFLSENSDAHNEFAAKSKKLRPRSKSGGWVTKMDSFSWIQESEAEKINIGVEVEILSWIENFIIHSSLRLIVAKQWVFV